MSKYFMERVLRFHVSRVKPSSHNTDTHIQSNTHTQLDKTTKESKIWVFSSNLNQWESNSDHEGGSQAFPPRLRVAVEGQRTWSLAQSILGNQGLPDAAFAVSHTWQGKDEACPVSATTAESSSE